MTKTERKALCRIAKRGRAGATAKQINRVDESAGLAVAAELVRRKLVVATPANRFVLARFGKSRSEAAFVADDDGRAGRFDHRHRAPLPRSTLKPQPVDITGLPITKLPPGEAIGAHDLQHWHSSKYGPARRQEIETRKARRKRSHK